MTKLNNKIKSLMEANPDLFPTEAKFWAYLRGCLRRGVWEKSPMKFKTKKAHLETPPASYTGRGKAGATCALSGVWEIQSKLEVDHLDGHQSFTKEEDIIPYIIHLLADGDELQLVTKEAHKIKSLADRRGISYDEAKLEKRVIEFGKLKAHEQRNVLEDLGYDMLPTKKARVEKYREIIKEETNDE